MAVFYSIFRNAVDRFQLMTVFVAVADEAGFAAAARKLGMSPPAVTRAVAALEDHLGVRLLNRTTRSVRTTEVGARYLEDARRILVEVAAADEAAVGINATPRGRLAVTAPALFGRIFVMPGIVAYLERYPETSVCALFVDRVVHLVDEGQDVGVRIGELPDSSMRALRVGSVRQVVCASPAYLGRNGRPETPEALAEHAIIASTATTSTPSWRFQGPDGPRAVRIRPRIEVNSNDGALEAACRGFGLSRLLSYQVAPQLERGELEIVLEDFEPTPRPIHIVHREGAQAPARVRAFVDLMAERLRGDRALN